MFTKARNRRSQPFSVISLGFDFNYQHHSIQIHSLRGGGMWGFEKSWLTTFAAIFLMIGAARWWSCDIIPFHFGRSKWWKIVPQQPNWELVWKEWYIPKAAVHWLRPRPSGHTSFFDAECALTELCTKAWREGLACAQPTLNAACVPT